MGQIRQKFNLLTLPGNDNLPRLAQAGLNAALVGLWLWLYRPLFNYLAIIFSRDDFRTNQVLLLGVAALLVWRVRHTWPHLRFDAAPRLYGLALALAMGGSALYLVAARFFDVNTLLASLFGLASYGLLGLWLSPRVWRQGAPAALLLIGTLPFGDHMQTFVGYPLRLFTAALVRDGLTAVGVPALGIDTILVLENGVSQVDLPCSGVKSLWTGLLFLLAATWLERRPLNIRWLLTALTLAAWLVIVNIGRVAALVVVGQALNWRLAAQIMHVPLGALGFVGVCAAAVILLRWFVPAQPVNAEAPSFHRRPAWLTPALALLVLVMTLLYAPSPRTVLAQPFSAWQFPAGLVTTPAPLTTGEADRLTHDGAVSANRWRFTWRGVSGTLMLITSSTWRAHHRPERCFEVYGLPLDDSRTYLVGPDFPARFVSLGGGALTATYWFQSAGRTTDDYGARIWADLSPRRQRWVLVSILFDRPQNPNDPKIHSFYQMLHEVAAYHLKGALP